MYCGLQQLLLTLRHQIVTEPDIMQVIRYPVKNTSMFRHRVLLLKAINIGNSAILTADCHELLFATINSHDFTEPKCCALREIAKSGVFVTTIGNVYVRICLNFAI